MTERGTDAQRRRVDQASSLLTGNEDASAAVAWLQNIRTRLLIPPLGSYGIAEDHLDQIIARAQQASIMKANPVVLTAGELRAILEGAI